ncbi:MAG: hypothetical protein KJ804_06235 [Proteobacteria bacterium]|nr:hypothetical protein [Pseudomonadota bacterium]
MSGLILKKKEWNYLRPPRKIAFLPQLFVTVKKNNAHLNEMLRLFFRLLLDLEQKI